MTSSPDPLHTLNRLVEPDLVERLALLAGWRGKTLEHELERAVAAHLADADARLG